MKKIIIAVLILVGVSSSAMAAGEAKLPVIGDPVAGEALAMVCAACHGPAGVSTTPLFPKLAGQHERYLFKQLLDVQSGDRVITAMTGLLDSLSEENLRDIAAYYASQPKSYARVVNPSSDPDADEAAEIAKVVALGERLFYGGNPDTGVAACSACHSPSGLGNQLAGYPLLSGQHADYTAKQLYAYQRGFLFEIEQDASEEYRVNDGDTKIMRSIAFKLKDHEISALANYIQGLRPRQ